jgi:hypothetical protein
VQKRDAIFSPVRKPVVLWEVGPVTCTCQVRIGNEPCRIALSVNGHVVERKVFQEAHAAARWAIDRMHAYAATQ